MALTIATFSYKATQTGSWSAPSSVIYVAVRQPAERTNQVGCIFMQLVGVFRIVSSRSLRFPYSVYVAVESNRISYFLSLYIYQGHLYCFCCHTICIYIQNIWYIYIFYFNVQCSSTQRYASADLMPLDNTVLDKAIQ